VSLATFTLQFLQTAIWASTDENETETGVPMDQDHGVDDFDPEDRKKLEAECAAFWEQAPADAKLRWDDEQAGHDFWLTRCGHGAGFWDGDYKYASGEDDGGVLTALSKKFGEATLYVGDDGKIHVA
jgi:hypothetical protein